MSGSAPEIRRVVLLPDVIGKSLFDPDCARILCLWRDGWLCPVTHQRLVAAYLKTLHRLGVAPRALKWWTWWLTDPAKVLYVRTSLEPVDLVSGCQALALDYGPATLVHAGSLPIPSDRQEVCSWLAASEFLKVLKTA